MMWARVNEKKFRVVTPVFKEYFKRSGKGEKYQVWFLHFVEVAPGPVVGVRPDTGRSRGDG